MEKEVLGGDGIGTALVFDARDGGYRGILDHSVLCLE